MVGAPINSHKLTLKFLCSYGGRILPRYPDGKLRYHGGETRVLSVDRSISFSELLVKLAEMCGSSVTLRCQFPTEDLDALVSITSDEDLANLIEEYDRTASSPSPSLKIRAFLSAPKTTNKSSSPPSSSASASTSASASASASASSSSNGSTSPKSPFYSSLPPRYPTSVGVRCVRHPSKPPVYPIIGEKAAGKLPHKYVYQYPNGGHVFVVQNGNHWQ